VVEISVFFLNMSMQHWQLLVAFRYIQVFLECAFKKMLGRSLLKLLLVDSDDKFKNFLEGFLWDSPFELVQVADFDEAETIVVESTFEALIIVQNQGQEGKGIALLDHIKANKIDFLATCFITPANFELLKNDYLIDWVLSKPFSFEGLQNLVVAMKTKASGNDDAVEEASAILSDLANSYEKTIPAKVARLQVCIDNLKISCDGVCLEALKSECQIQSDLAMTHDLPRVAEVCASFIDEIEFAKSQQEKALKTKSLTQRFDTLLRDVKIYYQIRDVVDTVSGLSNIDIYLLSEEAVFSDLFATESMRRSLGVKIEKDHKMALSEVESETFSPKHFIVSGEVTNERLALVEKFSEKETGTVSWILKEHCSVEQRYTLIDSGVKNIYPHTLSVLQVIDSVYESLERDRLTQTEFMLLSKDQELIDTIRNILPNDHLITSASETDSLQDIEAKMPQCIVMDGHLTGKGSEKYLKVIKSNPYSKKLPILLLTPEGEQYNIENLEGSQIDELNFPLDNRVLKQHLTILLQRASQLSEIETKDVLTRLLNRKTFLERAHSLLLDTQSKNQDFGMVYLGIDNVLRVCNGFMPFEFDNLIVGFADFLRESLGSEVLLARSAGAQFVLAIPNVEGANVELQLADCLTQLKRRMLMADRRALRVTFSAGICMCVNESVTIDDLWLKSSELFVDASREGAGRIDLAKSISLHGFKEDGIPEIYLIDNDENIVRMLKYVFENEGFKVTVNQSGLEAVKDLSERKESDAPSLVVLDRNLPDADGLTVLKGVNKCLKGRVPVVFLSARSSEAEILSGLKEGAIDYVTKPFSIKILIEKCKHLIDIAR
jgi:two-component system cell cycle response regulator